jgi:hypothetical protein
LGGRAGMSLIGHDDRRWTLWRVDGAEPVIKRGGSVIPLGEAVEVVPAEHLRAAVSECNRLRLFLEDISNTKSIDLAQGMALLALSGAPHPRGAVMTEVDDTLGEQR